MKSSEAGGGGGEMRVAAARAQAPNAELCCEGPADRPIGD